MREPYRLLRRVRGGNGVRRTDATPPGASTPFIGTAQAAAEASLRAMRLERIGAYLSHERLTGDLADQFSEDMAVLLRRGIIGKAGCSGELANVTYMLAKAKGIASVAQVSMQDHDGIFGVDEIRLFNLGTAARGLVASSLDRKTLIESLRDALPLSDDLDATGVTLAGILAWARLCVPNAILLVNASSDRRLAGVIQASVEPSLKSWIRQNPLPIARPPTSRQAKTP